MISEVDINQLAKIAEAVERIKELDPIIQTVSIRIDVYPVVIDNEKGYTRIIIGTRSNPDGISAFKGNLVFVIDVEGHTFYLLPTETMKEIINIIHKAGKSKKEMDHDLQVMTVAIPNNLLIKALNKTDGVQITNGNSS
jgi:hypothetical protein